MSLAALKALYARPPILTTRTMQLRVMSILQLIAWRTFEHDQWRTTQPEMARSLGVSVRTLKRYMVAVQDTGYVELQREQRRLVWRWCGPKMGQIVALLPRTTVAELRGRHVSG